MTRVLPLVVGLLFAALGTGALLSIMADILPAQAEYGRDPEATARRYYAAINEAVRTGDLSLLERVAAVERVDAAQLTVPGTPQCSLSCRVTALHRLAPQLRLVVDEVLVDGDRVAVRLTAQTPDSVRFLGLPLEGVLVPWSSLDLLRVENGRVVAVQPAAGPSAVIEPLLRSDIVSFPAAPFRLGLLRLTLEPGATISRRSTRGPLLMLVERGTLEVVGDRSIGKSPEERDEITTARTILPLARFELAAGNHLALADRTHYGLRNSGEESATVLIIAARPGEEGITNRWVRPRTLEEILIAPGSLETVAQSASASAAPAGVHGELLGEGIVGDRAAPLGLIALTRLTLPPHTAFPVHEAAGVEVIGLEAGTAEIDLIADQAAIQPQPGATHGDVATLSTGLTRGHALLADGADIVQPGTSAIRNVDDQPLTLLLLTLEPASRPA